MTETPKLACLECDWEVTVDKSEPPIEASNAAIDHYLVFGHSITRTDIVEQHPFNNCP